MQVMNAYERVDMWLPSFLTSALYRVGVRDSVGAIPTRYGMDGPGIDSRWGARLLAPFQTDPEAHPASCTMGTESP
jgi:hypothetical protein